jgi:hypothetical protein
MRLTCFDGYGFDGVLGWGGGLIVVVFRFGF